MTSGFLTKMTRQEFRLSFPMLTNASFADATFVRETRLRPFRFKAGPDAWIKPNDVETPNLQPPIPSVMAVNLQR